MRKALVVGLDNYPKCPLSGCVNDAIAVANIVSKNEDGSPNFEVKTILDIVPQRTLMKNIYELFDGNSDVELFYFAGHGLVNNGVSYVVTTDYDDYNYGVRLDDILQAANASKAKHKIIILDSCYSGAMGTPGFFGNDQAIIGDGLTILTSSMSNQTSAEVDGHGLFTALLLEALKGGAADVTGSITPGSIYAYIDKALGPWEQRPVFKTNVSSFLSIRNVLPSVPLNCLRNITSYFSDATAELSLNPSFEYTNHPDNVHDIVEPYSDDSNVAVFKDLQKLESVGLVYPVGEEHMYYAAMNSKSCKLTPLGQHYWNLVKRGKI
ncbi:MAG: caspase family protein [Clostridia bacterium]|nr:caspase family protein [Clostridia bacterium]